MQPNFQDTQPAPLHQLTGNALDEFRVGHPSELLTLLRQLVDQNVRVHLSAPNGGAYTTTVWTVDSHQGRLSLAADAAQPIVRDLVDAGVATAVAYLDSVKLQFELQHLVLVHGATASALQAGLPSVLYRFQRRESFRVRTPGNAAPTATMRHPSVPDMLLALRILDVSVGGCALALPADVPPLAAGIALGGVRIELDADARFETTLTLQHVSGGMGSSQPGQRLGCAFAKLDGAAQRVLQRYIDQTQKRQRLFSKP
ncbi:MAG: flagellar brake protein [Pseudomonadota bacterium]